MRNMLIATAVPALVRAPLSPPPPRTAAIRAAQPVDNAGSSSAQRPAMPASAGSASPNGSANRASPAAICRTARRMAAMRTTARSSADRQAPSPPRSPGRTLSPPAPHGRGVCVSGRGSGHRLDQGQRPVGERAQLVAANSPPARGRKSRNGWRPSPSPAPCGSARGRDLAGLDRLLEAADQRAVEQIHQFAHRPGDFRDPRSLRAWPYAS